MWCTCHSDIVPQIIHSVFADAGGVAASRSLRRHIYDNNHIIMGASHKQLHANYLMCVGGTMPETETTRAFACISRFSMWPRAERRRNVRHLQYIYISKRWWQMGEHRRLNALFHMMHEHDAYAMNAFRLWHCSRCTLHNWKTMSVCGAPQRNAFVFIFPSTTLAKGWNVRNCSSVSLLRHLRMT